MGAQHLGRLFRYRDEILYLVVADRMIQSIGGGNRADQDQHDESHALLPVVGAVSKAHTGASQDQQAANPEGRRCVAFGRLEKARVLD